MPAMDYSRIAELYDLYASTTFDVPFFIEETRDAQSVLELMAGTGRLSIPLLEAGVQLTCIDNSPDMLAVLRRKLDGRRFSAEVIEMDAAALDLKRRFDRILLPFHSFAELLTEADQRATLRAVRDHLTPDGRFICPLHNPPARLKTIDGSLRLVGKFAMPSTGNTLVLWSTATFNPVTRLVTGMQIYEIYDATGTMMNRRYLDLQFCLLDPEHFAEQAADAGFVEVSRYGDYIRAPYQPESSPFAIFIFKPADPKTQSS